MSTKEVTGFNPTKIMDGIRNDLKSKFMGLIPDEEWDEMIRKEFYHFTTSTGNGYTKNNSFIRTQSEQIIKEALKEEIPKKVKEYVNTKEFQKELLEVVQKEFPMVLTQMVSRSLAAAPINIYNQ